MSRTIFTRRFLTLVLAISVLLSTLAPAIAMAESSGIGGKPANPDSANPRTKTIFVKTMEPGTTVTDAVAVTNNTDTTRTILVYSTDSVNSSGGAFACAQAVDAHLNVGKWITLSQTSVDVPANMTMNVPFTITTPTNAEPGEENGCIVLQEKKDATIQGGIALNFRTAIRVAILTPGTIYKSVDTLSIDVLSQRNKVIISPTVKNTGNVSLDADVVSKVKTVFGTTLSETKDSFPILRNQLTTWNFELDKPFWGGVYIASYAVSYDKSNNFIGSVDMAAQIETIQGPSKLFFALPNLSAACIELFVVFVIVGLIVRYRISSMRRRVISEKWVNYTILETDQIQEIAESFGISWKALAKANGIKAPYNLIPGQTIKVPHVKKLKKSSKKRGNSQK